MSWTLGMAASLLVTDGGFWVCLAVGFIFGIILQFPVSVVLILALWAVYTGVGTVEMIRDWRRPSPPPRCL